MPVTLVHNSHPLPWKAVFLPLAVAYYCRSCFNLKIDHVMLIWRDTHRAFFFPVPVCAITASGVPGGTFVSMNRFSALCG
jgi:hypothetical protein